MKHKNPVLVLKNKLDEAMGQLALQNIEQEKTINDFNRLQQITCALILSNRNKAITVKGETMDLLDVTPYEIKMEVSEDQKKIIFTAVVHNPPVEELKEEGVTNDAISV